MLYLTLEVYLNDEAKFDSNSLMIVEAELEGTSMV
jgi:hypothetical protein